jgi:hypothetical protein
MVSDLIFIDILPISIVLSLERTQKLLCLLNYEILFRYFELLIVDFHYSLLMLIFPKKVRISVTCPMPVLGE